MMGTQSALVVVMNYSQVSKWKIGAQTNTPLYFLQCKELSGVDLMNKL